MDFPRLTNDPNPNARPDQLTAGDEPRQASTWAERFFRPLMDRLGVLYDQGTPQQAPAPEPGPELNYGPAPLRIPLLFREKIGGLAGARNSPATAWDGLLMGRSRYVRQLRIPRIRIAQSVSLRTGTGSSTLSSYTRIPATFIGQGPRDVLGQ